MVDGAIVKKAITDRVISDGAIADWAHRRRGHFRMDHPCGKNPFKKKKMQGKGIDIRQTNRQAYWPREQTGLTGETGDLKNIYTTFIRPVLEQSAPV